ncbi:hypothetical protein WICPIJ_005696 [Wickerhamomyces pijperi]|uniref:Phosphatidate cytidylyltransferase, mitochondrial n=1 Tax=Wickerhamomyces pijperi TaxID=599730 RepID=A0A9P8TLP0_WICPI|nr:hypothetical protein WICPIJ_005696 [Wickerhamomyces pijperi]
MLRTKILRQARSTNRTLNLRLGSSLAGSSKEQLERSILLRGYPSYIQPTKTKEQLQEEHEEKEALRLLDESIRKAEYLSTKFSTDFNRLKYQLPKSFGTNQYININDTNATELGSILQKFKAPIRYAFAYGSGVFSQGYTSKDTQTDMIFAVTYPDHWHSLNMKYNKDHYSSMRYFGCNAVAGLQEVGAGVYFNPYVEIDGQLVKYGVVSIQRLIDDLASWNSFYLAGRLQKPVKILRDDSTIRFWNQQNLRAAATLAFMNLPKDQSFDEFQFYRNITELSYKGDVRYLLGAENPKKIDNIVEKNFEYFQQYYSPIIDEVIKQKHFVLPPGFTEENANDKLKDIIFKTSALQTAKGLFTAGIAKSLKYAYAKKMKARGN